MFAFFPIGTTCVHRNYPDCKSFPGYPLNVNVSSHSLKGKPIIEVTWEPPITGESKEIVNKNQALTKVRQYSIRESEVVKYCVAVNCRVHFVTVKLFG